MALKQGLVLPVLRPWRSLPSEEARQAAVQSLQAPGVGHRGHDLSQHEAATQGLVLGDLPRQPEQGWDLFGGTRAATQRARGDRLADEAEDHGGDAPARRSETEAQGPGRDRRCISRRRTIRRQARARRGWQNALFRSARDDDRAPSEVDQAQDGQGRSQEGGGALRQGRDRAQEQCGQRRSVLLAGGHQGGRRSLLHAHRIWRPGGTMGTLQDGSTRCSALSRR